jgi:hypothetical protein
MCQKGQEGNSYSVANSEIKEFGNFDRSKPLEVKYLPILTTKDKN